MPQESRETHLEEAHQLLQTPPGLQTHPAPSPPTSALHGQQWAGTEVRALAPGLATGRGKPGPPHTGPQSHQPLAALAACTSREAAGKACSGSRRLVRGQARTRPACSPDPGLPSSGTGAELARTEGSPRTPMSVRQGRGTGLAHPERALVQGDSTGEQGSWGRREGRRKGSG